MTTSTTPQRVRSPFRRITVLTLRDVARQLTDLATAPQPAGVTSRLTSVAQTLSTLADQAGAGRGIQPGRLYQAASLAMVRASMILDGAGPVVRDVLRDGMAGLDEAAAMLPPSGTPHLMPVRLRGSYLDPQAHPIRPLTNRGRDAA